MPTKFALVIPGFQSDAQDWCIPVFTNLARELSRHVELHVFALRYPRRRERYDVGRVHVHALGSGALAGRRVPVVSLAKLWSDFLSEISKEHNRTPFGAVMGIWATEAGWLATRAAQRLGLRSLVHLAGGELTNIPEIGYGNLRRGLAGRLVMGTIANANLLTVPSALMRGALLRTGTVAPDKVIDWAPGVDTAMFVTTRRANFQTGLFNMIVAGSLIPVKGHDLLLRGLALAREKVPQIDLRLRIVGTGPLERPLKALVVDLKLKGYVSFEGEVRHDALPGIYGESDAFLLGSWHEAQCMALLEAMSCGLPWIGPPVGVLPDVAGLEGPIRSGVLFRERNPHSVANAIVSVARLGGSTLAEWGEHSRVIVVRHYGLVEQTAKLLALLEGLTSHEQVAYDVEAPM